MDVMPQRSQTGGIQRSLVRNFLTWLHAESDYQLADEDGEALGPGDLDEIIDDYFLSL